MNELVTIIIPTYKGSEKINNAVDSVIKQTYQNIEIIVVDDNGRGKIEQLETEACMKKYSNDQRVHYIVHKVNKNGSAARNTGIRTAKGEYLGFLDDDDEFLPSKIEIQMNAFSNVPNNVGLIYTGFEEIIDRKHSRSVHVENVDNFLFGFLCDKIIACSSTVLIRRAVLDKVAEWDESFRRHQDLEFFARIAFNYNVYAIDEICVRKYKLDRNVPKGETYEKYHLHYLNKMKNIIDTFSEKEKLEFYDWHYLLIGKFYLKNHDLKKSLIWAKKTTHPFITMIKYINDAGMAIMRRFTQKSRGNI